MPFYGPIRSSDVISIGSYDFRLGAVEEENDNSNSNVGFSATSKEVTQKVDADEDWTMQTYIGGALDNKTPEDRAGEIERQRMFMWRNRIHQEVLRMMDLKRTDVGSMDEIELKQKVEGMIDEALESMAKEIPDNIDVTELKTSVLNLSLIHI